MLRPGEIVLINPGYQTSYVRWPAVKNHEDVIFPGRNDPLPSVKDAVAIVLSSSPRLKDRGMRAFTTMIYALTADSPGWQLRAAMVET